MNSSLNSLKGVIWGIKKGTTIADIKGNTRSSDYSSYSDYISQALRWILTNCFIPWELWYYSILRSCRIFSINSTEPRLRESVPWQDFCRTAEGGRGTLSQKTVTGICWGL